MEVRGLGSRLCPRPRSGPWRSIAARGSATRASAGIGRALVLGLALGTVALAAAPTVAEATDDPTAVVERLHAGMLAVMREAGQLDYQQRFDRLVPALEQAYDFDFMARKSLGRAYDGLDPASQERWLALFRTYTIANYAGRFGKYHGQTFQTLGEEPSTQETVLVRTRLDDPGAETVDLNYRLRRSDAGWRVVDVYLKGTVSELALRRSDFGATLDRSGFASLAQSLEGKIADLAAGKVK